MLAVAVGDRMVVVLAVVVVNTVGDIRMSASVVTDPEAVISVWALSNVGLVHAVDRAVESAYAASPVLEMTSYGQQTSSFCRLISCISLSILASSVECPYSMDWIVESNALSTRAHRPDASPCPNVLALCSCEAPRCRQARVVPRFVQQVLDNFLRRLCFRPPRPTT